MILDAQYVKIAWRALNALVMHFWRSQYNIILTVYEIPLWKLQLHQYFFKNLNIVITYFPPKFTFLTRFLIVQTKIWCGRKTALSNLCISTCKCTRTYQPCMLSAYVTSILKCIKRRDFDFLQISVKLKARGRAKPKIYQNTVLVRNLKDLFWSIANIFPAGNLNECRERMLTQNCRPYWLLC